jgi:hypothetical protein
VVGTVAPQSHAFSFLFAFFHGSHMRARALAPHLFCFCPCAPAHSLMPHEAGHMPRRYISIQTRKQALPSWLQRPPEMPAGCIKQVHKPSVSIGKTRAASSIFRSPRSTGSGARACSPARRPFASADFFFEITVLSLGGILLMA